MNRSGEELAMRDRIEEWGRARWPEARVVHELVVQDRRIDMAFVSPEHLAGVEIKSSRDVLDRVDQQLSTFTRHIPEVWLALAPKWVEPFDSSPGAYSVGRLIVTEQKLKGELRSAEGRWLAFPRAGRIDRTITAPMLQLLWHAELASICARKRVYTGKSRLTIAAMVAALARKLTGDEVVAEVCRELRGRNAFWKSDLPIFIKGV